MDCLENGAYSESETNGESVEVDHLKLTINKDNYSETYKILRDLNLGNLTQGVESQYEVMSTDHHHPEPIYTGPPSNPRSICLDFSVNSSAPSAKVRAPWRSGFKSNKIYETIPEEKGRKKKKKKDKGSVGKTIKTFAKKFGLSQKRKTPSRSPRSSRVKETVSSTDESSYTTTYHDTSSTPSLSTLSRSRTSCSDVISSRDVINTSPQKPARRSRVVRDDHCCECE